MAITLSWSRSSARPVFATLAVAFVLEGARPASAQWDPRDAALSRCQQELQYRMGREAGGKQPEDVVDLGRGEYSIVNQRSNKALTVGGGGSDGANIEQNRWSGGDNQRWRLERAGDGAYRIVSQATRSCLDVQGAKREDGANIQTWGCSGGANQAWLFRK